MTTFFKHLLVSESTGDNAVDTNLIVVRTEEAGMGVNIVLTHDNGLRIVLGTLTSAGLVCNKLNEYDADMVQTIMGPAFLDDNNQLNTIY